MNLRHLWRYRLAVLLEIVRHLVERSYDASNPTGQDNAPSPSAGCPNWCAISKAISIACS
jgi:hypothetical protein